MTCRVIVATVMAVVVLAGCAGTSPVATSPPPTYEASLTLVPRSGDTLASGEVVELVFTSAGLRGLVHTLQHWDGSEWEDVLYATAFESSESASDTRWVASLDQIETGDIGFDGALGGLFLRLPEQPTPYRVCAEGTDLCSEPVG